MKAAFVFPGQGEDLAPLLTDWVHRSSAVRRRIDEAAAALGVGVADLLAKGCRSLRSTRVYQPVSTALGLGIVDELRERGVRPDLVAGHSLGELPAATIAGFLAPEDTVRIACLRGRLMAEAAAARPGGMGAVADADPDSIREILSVAHDDEVLVVAAFNSPAQTVLAGDSAALRRCAPRVTRLPVEGAWHSPLMWGAVASYREALEEAATDGSEALMVFNGTGRVEVDVRSVACLLSDQLVQPILWTRVVGTIRSNAPEVVLPIGPSRVLCGLLRDQNGPPLNLLPVETAGDLDHPDLRLLA